MFRKFRKFIGVLLARPRKAHITPFEAARRSVAEKEYISRQAWEERERMWEAKRRCLGGENGR